jgi:hypothetical protein
MGKVIYLAQYKQEKLAEEIRKDMETVHPHTEYGGPVQLPSLDDYDAEGDWWEGYEDSGLLD